MKIYIDIETIPEPKEKRLWNKPVETEFDYGILKDPEKKRVKFAQAESDWESGEGCGLSPMEGQIAILGMLVGTDTIQPIYGLLGIFLKSITPGTTIVGFNCISFDLPFIIKRAIIERIPVPQFLIRDLNQYRPEMIRDLRNIWNFGDRHAKGKLDEIYQVVTGKPFPIFTTKSGIVISGATFAQAWRDDPDTCYKYNRNDLECTKELDEAFTSMGL